MTSTTPRGERIALARVGAVREGAVRVGAARVGAVLAGAALLLSATGCAGRPVDGASSSPASATTAATAFPMPDLGPSPAPAALDADQAEQLRLESQDDQWQGVLAGHPGATRPSDPFVAYRSDGDLTVLADCLTG